LAPKKQTKQKNKKTLKQVFYFCIPRKYKIRGLSSFPNHQKNSKEMHAQATPERKRSLECEDLTPDERASQVKRIKAVLADLEDLPCKITDALNRTWHRVPVDLSGELTDVVTIDFIAKALYDAHKVAVAMASISFLHNVDDEAMRALLDGPSLKIRAAPDPEEMMIHMTANGTDIGYYGAPEAKFTFTGDSKSLAAMIIQNAPKKARRTIEVEDEVDPPDVILEGLVTITKRTAQGQ
jgi:hypothetical protein